MRLRPVLLLIATAPLALGCFAMDLIDDGMEEMERYSGPETEEAAESPAATAKKDEKPTAEQLRQWWSSATTLAPKADSGVVQCEIRGSVQFTRKTDCLTRGGRILKTGG